MINAELINNMRACIRLGVLIDDCDITDDCNYSEDGECGDCMLRMVNDAADALEAAEQRIAELEAQIPKEGEWIDEQRGRWIYAKCNLCGKVQDVRSNYCPNCGAKMKGEHDEQID